MVRTAVRPQGTAPQASGIERIPVIAQFAVQQTTLASAVTLIASAHREHHVDFAEDVREGLTSTPKRLSCRYFYDEEGSALFEEICELPEYYVTRAEHAILDESAAEIAALFPQEVGLVELGSGNAVKTRLLMQALIERHGHLRFIPIDISRFALEESAKSLVEEFDNLEILAVAGDYTDGLEYLKQSSDERRLILWLGSNIGNFDRPEAAAFLHRVHDAMETDDRFLVGIDLRKDRLILEAAYDDSRGVTARFNKNILKRVNTQLGGHFDLDRFRHLARYDDDLGRVEMHLVATSAHTVSIDAIELEVEFADGESIHTENSYKYSQLEIDELTAGSAFRLERQWFDDKHRFSLNLFRPR